MRPKLSEDLVSKEDVETVVKKSLGTGFNIINYQRRIFSEESLGFMGVHRHLVITVRKIGSENNEMYTYFVKSIPHDIEEQALLLSESNAFYKEANFYLHVVPKLLSETKDKSWIGECYLAKENLLVFENLADKNFKLESKLLNQIELQSALSSLAKLHASSILAEKRMGKCFAELHPEVFCECLYVKNGKFYEWFCAGVDVMVAVAKHLELDATKIPQICNRIFDMILTSTTRQNVVCHGDTKSFNFMFDNTKPYPKCVLVDFQLARYVPPMTDVSQFLYLSTKRSTREPLEKDLLKHYHQVFSKTLSDGRLQVKIPTYEDILQEYEDLRLIGLVSTAICSPMNHIEGKESAQLTKDSDSFSTFFFQDRTDLVLNMMQRNETYNEIITDIVLEMLERSDDLLRK